MRKLLLITMFLLVGCGDEHRSKWDYQAGFCRKVPECLVDRQERNYNPSIYVWISDDQVFMESEFYIPEYAAVLSIGGKRCVKNLTPIFAREIIPYGIKCKRDKDIHHSHIGQIYVSVEGHDTYDCHHQPQLSTEEISIYRCRIGD